MKYFTFFPSIQQIYHFLPRKTRESQPLRKVTLKALRSFLLAMVYYQSRKKELPIIEFRQLIKKRQ